MATDTREHMIETTAALVHRRGFYGTSLSEILAQSGAPRGSLYYHFPGGKEELVLEATRRGVASVTQLLKEEVLTDSADPADGMRTFIEAVAQVLRDSGYVFGCPVAPIVLDSPESSALGEVCQEAFEQWRQVLVEALGRRGGIERGRAESLATVVVCAVEGGLLLARARRDIAPLEAVAEELAVMIRSALPRSRPA